MEKLDLRAAVETLERRMIGAAMAQTSGNQVQAARILGISREGLRKKMDRFGLKA